MTQGRSASQDEEVEGVEEVYSSSEQLQETQREILEITIQKGCWGVKGPGHEDFGLFLLVGQEGGQLGLFLNRALSRASGFLLGCTLGAGKM